MTAYVNDEQKKEGAYGKAVKATLAATLAAGMVPAAAAFADDAQAETASEGDIELLSASAKDAWENGAFTVADNAGKVVYDKMTKAEIAEAVKDEPVEFIVDGDAHFLVPTMVAPMGGADAEVFADNAEYKVEYKTKAGATVKADEIKTAGEYQVVVTAVSGDYSTASATFDFELVDATTDIKDAVFYQVGENEEDFSDDVIEYAGKYFQFGAKYESNKVKLNIAVDGEALVNGTDYTFQVFSASDPSKPLAQNPKDCGKYIVKFTGKGAYAGTFQANFEIVELDLAKADIELDFTDGNALKPVVKSINDGTALNGAASVEVTKYPELGNGSAKGEYVYTVSANGTNANVKGSQTIKHVVAANTATFKYGDAALEDAYDVNHVDGDKDFDLSKVVACDKSGEALDAKAYSVKVYDAEGNEVSASKISEAGVWTVKVVVDAKATDYEYAGEAETVVTVTEGDVADGNVYFTFGGKVVKDGVEATYDGSDALKKLGVKLYDAKGNEVSASDYKVEVKDSEGEVVTSAVDAGTYTVSVTSDKYTIAKAQTLTVRINAIKATDLRLDPAQLLFGDVKDPRFAFTGEAIVPAIQYKTTDAEGNVAWVELPAEAYAATYKFNSDLTGVPTQDVKEVKEVGSYFVNVSDVADEKNYEVATVTELGGKFKVTDEKVFSDVPNTEWYYEHVYNAKEAGYMKGIGDSEIFAPNQTTSRAMAAQVLARMASAKTGDEAGMSFSDVAADAWYADAVAWAASTGVVSGYPGTDEFRPESNVTRAEFCVMMQRYANATGQGVALEAGEADKILAKYEDGAAVADWCKDAVAWAVKNEIFGGYSLLNPAGDITRAEMAKMTTVFQPEAL